MQRLRKLLIGSLLIPALIILMAAPAWACSDGNEQRLPGQDRYAAEKNNSGGLPSFFDKNDGIVKSKYDHKIKIKRPDINRDKAAGYIGGGKGDVKGLTFDNIGTSRGYQRNPKQAVLVDPLRELGSNDAKCALIFGSAGSPVYQNAAEAQADMVNISVDVWQLDANGEKYPAQLTLTINKAIADRIQSVFMEIFAGQEKFPIYCVQGYCWRSGNTSEHNCGLAVDINPNENYMINNSGAVVAGSFWDPAKSPYSISEKGDVVTAFNKYGFTWGGNAWKSSNDYMHFSYLGR